MESRIQQMHSAIITASQTPDGALTDIAKKDDISLQQAIVKVSEEISRLTQALEAERQAYQSVHAHLVDKLEAAKNYKIHEQSKIYNEIGDAKQLLRRLERQFDWLQIDYRSQLKDRASWLENFTDTQNQIAAIQTQIAKKLENPALVMDDIELKHLSQSLLEGLPGLKLNHAELEEKIRSQSQPQYCDELQAQYQQLGEDIALKEQQYRSIAQVLDKRALNKEEIALLSHMIAAHVDYTTTDSYRSKLVLIAHHTSMLQELEAKSPLQPPAQSAGPSALPVLRIAGLFASASVTTLHSEAISARSESARSTL